MKEKLMKYLKGAMNDREAFDFRKEVELMSDEELDEYLNSCEPDFVFTDSDINAIQDSLNREIKSEKRHMILNTCLKASAAVILLAIIVCGCLLWNSYIKLTKYQTLLTQNIVIATENGESSMTILPDGSKIFMGPGSTLSYNLGSFNSESRQIIYTGEGLFNIAKKIDVPFRLIVNDCEIKVLGTVFSLYGRKDKPNTEVYLEEGSLMLKSLISDCEKIIVPGETAVFNNISGDIDILENDSDHRRTAGQPIMYFKSAPLRSVASELELYYGKEVIVNADLENIQFTGSLPTDNIKQAIFVLENALNISIATNTEDNELIFKP